MFLVIASLIADDAWPLRATEVERVMGGKADRLIEGCESGRRKHVDLVWMVPTLIDAQACMASIDMIEDALIETSIREQ